MLLLNCSTLYGNIFERILNCASVSSPSALFWSFEYVHTNLASELHDSMTVMKPIAMFTFIEKNNHRSH